MNLITYVFVLLRHTRSLTESITGHVAAGLHDLSKVKPDKKVLCLTKDALYPETVEMNTGILRFIGSCVRKAKGTVPPRFTQNRKL